MQGHIFLKKILPMVSLFTVTYQETAILQPIQERRSQTWTLMNWILNGLKKKTALCGVQGRKCMLVLKDTPTLHQC